MKLLKDQKGFTLLEMIAVFSLFAIFSVVVTFRQDGFRSQLTLEQTLSEMSIFIQSVQASAVTASDESVSKRRGVNLKKSASGEVSIVSFADSEQGTIGEYEIEDLELEVFTVPEEVSLLRVCLQKETQADVCLGGLFHVDVIFERANNRPGILSGGASYDSLRVDLEGKRSTQLKSLFLNQSGVVYVQ